MLGKHIKMTRLTVHINNQNLKNKVKDFLNNLGLEYQSNSLTWWKNDALVEELNQRSDNLKSGKDIGVSFTGLKK